MKVNLSSSAAKIVTATLLTLGILAGCRKPEFKKSDQNGNVRTITAPVPATISMEEIYAQLPQTIMYNLAGQISIDVSLAEWRYESDHLIVRIPLKLSAEPSYITP